MRDKYIEERFPRYFIFGADGKGMVDVASTDYDTIISCTEEQANVLIADRDKVINMLSNLAVALSHVDNTILINIYYNGMSAKQAIEKSYGLENTKEAKDD